MKSCEKEPSFTFLCRTRHIPIDKFVLFSWQSLSEIPDDFFFLLAVGFRAKLAINYAID